MFNFFVKLIAYTILTNEACLLEVDTMGPVYREILDMALNYELIDESRHTTAYNTVSEYGIKDDVIAIQAKYKNMDKVPYLYSMNRYPNIDVINVKIARLQKEIEDLKYSSDAKPSYERQHLEKYIEYRQFVLEYWEHVGRAKNTDYDIIFRRTSIQFLVNMVGLEHFSHGEFLE